MNPHHTPSDTCHDLRSNSPLREGKPLSRGPEAGSEGTGIQDLPILSTGYIYHPVALNGSQPTIEYSLG